MRTRAGLGLAIVLALVACGSSHPRVVQGAPPSPGQAELRKLAQMALDAARGAGELHPTGAVVVPTTRQVAERVDAGAGVDSNQPVYFVLLHGDFTGNEAPAGAALPTGTILTLTIDAKTNRTTDTGIEKHMPDLNAIGKSEPLPLDGAASAAEIQTARATNPTLFSIFPSEPGVRRCQIPSGAGLVGKTISGTCETRVWHPNTHGHGEARVEFRESWGNGHHSSWTLWEKLPVLEVLGTKLHGEPSPQMRYRATE